MATWTTSFWYANMGIGGTVSPEREKKMSGYNADMSQPAERDDEETVDVTPSAEFQIQALNNMVAQLEREKGYEADRAKRYRDLLIHLAEQTMSLAETLDYEIGEKLKYALSDLADRGIVDLPTKTVTLKGSYTREYEYSIEVKVPVFSDPEEIDHMDYIDEITEVVDDNQIDWTLNPGETYEK